MHLLLKWNAHSFSRAVNEIILPAIEVTAGKTLKGCFLHIIYQSLCAKEK